MFSVLAACGESAYVGPSAPQMAPVNQPPVSSGATVFGKAVRLVPGSGFTIGGVGTDVGASGNVVDEYDHGVPGVAVSVELVEGNGQLASTAFKTHDNGGLVVEGWRLGPMTGPNRLKLSSPGLPDTYVQIEGVIAPAELEAMEYAMTAVSGAPLPKVGARVPNSETLIASTFVLDRGNFRASYTFLRGGIPSVDHVQGTYVQNGVKLTFPPEMRLWGVVSADGRLQLYNDSDEWRVSDGQLEEFVRLRK